MHMLGYNSIKPRQVTKFQELQIRRILGTSAFTWGGGAKQLEGKINCVSRRCCSINGGFFSFARIYKL